MSIEVDLYLREGQTSPLSTIQVDRNWLRIKTAFTEALSSAGSVTVVSASIFSGLSVNVTNPTTTPAISITTALNGFLKGNGSGFTAQASISLTSDVTGITPIANGGTNNDTFTAHRAIVYDGTKLSTINVTTTELGYLAGVTSNIQTQLNGKQPSFSILPYANGGTNYSASSRQDLINNLTNSSTATTGWVLQRDSGGNAIFAVSPSSGVSSVNGLTGAVTLTVSNTINPFAWTGGNLNIPTADASTTGLLSNTDWIAFSSTVSAAGSNTQIQYNNSGSFGASSDFTFDNSTKRFTVGNVLGKILVGTGTIIGDISISKNPAAGVGGVGYYVKNLFSDAASDAVYQAVNSNGSQDVRLIAKDPLSGENAYVGTASNSKFAIRTNATEGFVQDTLGRVGIGTASPTTKLVLNDTISTYLTILSTNTPNSTSGITVSSFTSSANIVSRWENGSITSFGTVGSYDLIFNTNSTERIRFLANGNIITNGVTTSLNPFEFGRGLGLSTTINSSAPSVIADNIHQVYTGSGGSSTLPPIASCTHRVHVLKNRGSGNWTINGNTATDIYNNAVVASVVVYPGQALTIVNDGTYWNVSSGDLFWASNGNNIFNTNSGNIGIGTNSPTAILDIVGTSFSSASIRSTSAGSNSILSVIGKDGGSSDIGAFIGANGFVTMGSYTNHRVDIWTNGVERMIILPGGNIGVRITSPTAYFHIDAGTATANTAPLKFTIGSVNTTPETGALEYSTIASVPQLTFVRAGTTRQSILMGNIISGSFVTINATKAIQLVASDGSTYNVALVS